MKRKVNTNKKTKAYRKSMKSGSVPQQKQLTEQLYDSTADFGVFMALVGLIGASITGFVMICIALYLIFNNGTHSKQTEAKVIESKCDIYKNSKNKTHKDCNNTVKYNINNEEYENIISTNKVFANNSTVQIVYDPKNPNDSLIKTGMRRTFAYILIGLAVIIVIAAVIRYYIVKTYKVAAAATGVGEAASIVATPFQSSEPSYIDNGSTFDSSDSFDFVGSMESE